MPYTRLTSETVVVWQPGKKGSVSGTANQFATIDEDPNIGIVAMSALTFNTDEDMPDYARIEQRVRRLAFTTRLRGAHTEDDVPPEAVLFRACGFQENMAGSTPNIAGEYRQGDLHDDGGTPVGDLEVVLGLGIYRDRLFTLLLNPVGNVVIEFEAGKLPLCHWAFTGEDTGVDTAEASPTEAFVAGSKAAPFQSAGLTISGVSGLKIQGLIYDAGNQLLPRPDANGAFGVAPQDIPSRVPIITMIVEDPLLDDIDFETLFLARTAVAVAFVHNTGAGVGQELAVSFTGYLDEFPKLLPLNGRYYRRLVFTQKPSTGATALNLKWKSTA